VLPGNLNLRTPDPTLGAAIVAVSQRRPVRRVLSNSFGFGGNNCSLVFGAA
jgi:3-oxoacyl-[acyl-carrier-protein] synthase-1